MRIRLIRLRDWCASRLRTSTSSLSDVEQAQRLITAIDAGGIPLNPLRVNTIARNLGLDVSRSAPVEETVTRIRRALQRAGNT